MVCINILHIFFIEYIRGVGAGVKHNLFFFCLSVWNDCSGPLWEPPPTLFGSPQKLAPPLFRSTPTPLNTFLCK